MISLEELGQAIFEGAVAGLRLGAEEVATLARAKAPVRSVFSDGGYGIRTMSANEIEAGRSLRDHILRTMSPKPTVVQPGDVPQRWLGTTTGKKPPTHWRERRMSAATRLLEAYDAEMTRRRTVAGYVPQKTMLSTRGAYEVRTQRARFRTWGHAAIGGRLRGSITATPPTVEGYRAEAWVVSDGQVAPYARFQEFGTRHNAAHPFLRPAAEEGRQTVVSMVADAVREAARAGTQAEIVVRL